MVRETRVVREDDGWAQEAAPDLRTRRQNVPPPPPRKGQAPRRWAYGYPEIAKLLDMSEDAVRKAVSRRKFNPRDLADVVRYLRERGG